MRRIAIRWTIGVLLLSLSGLTGCGSGEAVPLPPQLAGLWRASDALYEDRYLELDPSEVRFGTGAESATVHPIAEIRRLGASDGAVYEITYYLSAAERDATFLLSLRYSETDRVLRLVHRPEISWTRTASFE